MITDKELIFNIDETLSETSSKTPEQRKKEMQDLSDQIDAWVNDEDK